MLENTIKNKVGDLIKEIKTKVFLQPGDTTNREAFGIMMSKFFGWSGICIAEAAVEALKDANFRVLAENLETLIEFELARFDSKEKSNCVVISKQRLEFLIKKAGEV